MELAAQLVLEVIQCKFTKEDLLQADSAFYCGTAAEVVGIASVDDYQFPKNWNGSLGKKLQNAYSLLVRDPLKQNPFN